MLNYADKNTFFVNCLVQCGLTDGRLSFLPNLEALQSDEKMRTSLKRSLNDIRVGADAVFARGKPAENTLGISFEEWEQRWTAWSSSRSAAFHSRAALFMLGEQHYLGYMLNILRSSHNAVFLSNASDLLQHASGHYLSGPSEDLTRDQLADYWERRFNS